MRNRSVQDSSVIPAVGLSRRQRAAKRALDVVVAGVGTVVTSPLMAAGFVVATVDTREWGIFTHIRVGRNGRPVRVHKLRTMRSSTTHTTTVTTIDDPRITRIGRQLRRFKIDELPQLVDVLVGSMSLVGPRPDVTGWADRLQGRDQIILSVRPGITGPATLAFRNEEEVLSRAADPEQHNRDVIWPQKVRLNRNYVEAWSLKSDIHWLVRTVVSVTSHQARSSDERQAAR